MIRFSDDQLRDATHEEILSEIERISGIAALRSGACQDMSIRGLRPYGTDWMTEEEIVYLDKLQVVRIRRFGYLNSPDAARLRVEAKRAARRAMLAKIGAVDNGLLMENAG